MTFKRLVMIFVSITVVAVTASWFGLGGFSTSGGDQLVQTGAEGTTTAVAATPTGDGLSEVKAETTPTSRVTAGQAAGTTQPTPARTMLPEEIITKRMPLIFLNPSVGVPGSAVSIAGSGFDPNSTIDLSLQREDNTKPADLGFAQADQSGSFGGVSFAIPTNFLGGTFTVVAQQENSDHVAKATGRVRQTSPTVVFGTQVGKTGDSIGVSGKGFAPEEDVQVFFNTMKSAPITTFKTDRGGSFNRAVIIVPYGPSGNNSFVLVGKKSQSPVTSPFLMLNFYPTGTLSAYALKADTTLQFTGSGFGPNERVLVFLNSMQASPVAEVQADGKGGFKRAGGFTVPFELRGKNTFIFVGEQSRATVTAGFDVLPYTPYAEASTYGGRPGTSVTFYGRDFARNELVRVYVGRAKDSAGQEVSCFKTDTRGNVNGGGMYTIPPQAQKGQLTFALVGQKSRAQATANFEVMESTGPMAAVPSAPQQDRFVCPYDKEASGPGGAVATPVPPEDTEEQQVTPQGTSQAAPAQQSDQPDDQAGATDVSASPASDQPENATATAEVTATPPPTETTQPTATTADQATQASPTEQPSAAATSGQQAPTPPADQGTAAPSGEASTR